MRGLPEEALREAEKFCMDEYEDHLIYSYLASKEKGGFGKTLEGLAKEEYAHYLFWRKILGRDCAREVGRAKLLLVRLLRIVFGLTFTLKLMEGHEGRVVESYKKYLNSLEDEDRRALEAVIEDEIRHEEALISGIDETVVKYMSFIVLGLADAIIEITGVHAGFLGVTNYTIMAGIAGLVVGISAAVSMASAAYLQAKHEMGRNPLTSALMTGLGYIAASFTLATPYLLVHRMLLAFTTSLGLGVVLIAAFTYYGAVVFDRSFGRELAESVSLMLATALGSYIFGEVIGGYFGIRGAFG